MSNKRVKIAFLENRKNEFMVWILVMTVPQMVAQSRGFFLSNALKHTKKAKRKQNNFYRLIIFRKHLLFTILSNNLNGNSTSTWESYGRIRRFCLQNELSTDFLGRCRLLLFFQVAKFTNDSHFSNCPPSLNPVVKQETDKCKYQFVSM